MSTVLCFDVKIPIRSPFLFEALDPSGLGLDCSAMRDRSGRPLIPGDHLRGHLSHAIRALGRTDAKIAGRHRELFGAVSEARKPNGNAQDVPLRGRIDVSDFAAAPRFHPCEECMSNTPSADLPRTGTAASVRVRIDDATGAAKEGMLQFIELVAPPGAVVTFEGKIRIRADETALADLKQLIEDALKLIPAMGGAKSAGFGAIVTDRVSVVDLQEADVGPGVPTDGDRFEVTVSFDRPILVDGWSNASNLFRGNTIVPGGAIKGAVATLLSAESNGRLDGEIGEALSAVLVSHAFPLVEGKAETVRGDRAVPMSIAAIVDSRGEVRFADAVDPAVSDALVELTDTGVAHQGDWKNEVWKRVRELTNRPDADLDRQVRGRVGISDAGLAEKGKLFVVAPVETTGRNWRFVVDRCNADKAAFRRLLEVIDAGVVGIGRTGARMCVTSWKEVVAAPPVASSLLRREDLFVVTLETGAMLTDPTCDLAYSAQYAAALRVLAGSPDLELVDHFAQRRTIGGHLSHRYRRLPGRYLTSELTLPGSVFVLAGAGAKDFLTTATKRGLGAVQFVAGKAEIVTDWQITPFVAENGWGEISVTKVDGEILPALVVDVAKGA